jgi:putative endonuclease
MVYILASARNGTLYIGVTSDLCGRIAARKQGLLPGFTKKYGVKLLVYVEEFATMDEAIAREKQLKRWRREWKIVLTLIEKKPQMTRSFHRNLWNNHLTLTPLSRTSPRSARRSGMTELESVLIDYEHPLVEPHVSHFKHVPFLTMVKFPHSEQLSPS